MLEESSPTDEGLTRRGKTPTNGREMRHKGVGPSGRPVRKRVRLGDAIARAVNHMSSVIDKAYTSESPNISLKEYL